MKTQIKCIFHFAKYSVEVTHTFKSRYWWLQGDLTKKWKSLVKFEWVKEMKNYRHWWYASRVPKATWQKNLLYIILFTSIQIMGKNVKAPITSMIWQFKRKINYNRKVRESRRMKQIFTHTRSLELLSKSIEKEPSIVRLYYTHLIYSIFIIWS